MNKTDIIAQVAHEANKAFCEANGDFSHKSWGEAPEWSRESSIKGVQFRLDNPRAFKSAQHDQWMTERLANGWVYGEVKDAEKKTHNCLVPYDELPEFQQKKDALFISIVEALK